jgi:hypothetical protein
MKITTTRIILGAAILIGLSQGENVRNSLEKSNALRQEQSQFQDRIRQNRTESRQAEKLSKIALDRYRNNCILVVDQETGKESYFQPGTQVVDVQLGRSLRSGVPICNKLGDTGIVSEAGTITDVARVAIPDVPAFKELLSKRRSP